MAIHSASREPIHRAASGPKASSRMVEYLKPARHQVQQSAGCGGYANTR